MKFLLLIQRILLFLLLISITAVFDTRTRYCTTIIIRLDLEIKCVQSLNNTQRHLVVVTGWKIKYQSSAILWNIKCNAPGSIPEYSELDVVVWTPLELVSLPPLTPRACSLTSSGFTWCGSNRSHWPISFIIWSRVIRSGLLILVRFFNISLPSSSLLK